MRSSIDLEWTEPLLASAFGILHSRPVRNVSVRVGILVRLERPALLFHFLAFALFTGYAYISRLHCCSNAQVVKLVNTRDLKSLDFGLAGSSPALGTIFLINELFSGMDDAIVSLYIFL